MDTEKRIKDAKLTDDHRQESARLKKLYMDAKHGLSQAAFGEIFGIGNQGAVWQCLNGRGMPISLKAARGFAKGLNCSISDFSPRLAVQAQSNIFYSGPISDIIKEQMIDFKNDKERPIERALGIITTAMMWLDESQREKLCQKITALAVAPDSLKLRQSIIDDLEPVVKQLESPQILNAPSTSKSPKKRPLPK